MAVTLKVAYFDTAVDLANFVSTNLASQANVVSIVTDNSGKYVLFYT